ncbi:NaeI family type II restriction endonuclease [Streptomyces kurssanovii]|uniref:NaeI family type II restriction endonuclease n=1 Tax=Streptomyces kurssanovii TaxID=67312 RepID=A0ABV3I0M5_9ACTN
MFSKDHSAAVNVTTAAQHSELLAVKDHLLRQDPDGQRFGRVLRDTFDQLLNGEVTGRYAWSQLRQTEKTHAGSMVEINLHREFNFDDGTLMDYRIAGVEVDCKYSQTFGQWMIPPEATGHICLLVWADDQQSRWSAGLLRIRRDLLNGGENRDLKTTIKASARSQIEWVWQNAALPENLLLHLDPATREKILIKGPRKGQQRVNQLFRLVHGRRIGRGVVRTAGQQHDYMARVREGDPGRARPKLRKEGIIILGDYKSHQAVAAALGGPVPEKGEFVAFRVARRRPYHHTDCHVELEGERWVVATAADPPQEAPRLPDAQ